MRKLLLVLLCVPSMVVLAGSGLTFDGSDDSIDCGSDASLDNMGGYITMSAWIYPDTIGENSRGRIISKRIGGDGFEFTVFENTNLLVYLHGTDEDAQAVSSANSLLLGQWQHVVGLFDSSKAPHLYIDGAEVSYVSQQSWEGSVKSHAHLSLLIGDNTDNRHFDGLIDEVYIYKRALSLSEIEHMFHSGGAWHPRGALRGYWGFENHGKSTGGYLPNSSTAKDKSVEGNDGTVTDGEDNSMIVVSSPTRKPRGRR